MSFSRQHSAAASAVTRAKRNAHKLSGWETVEISLYEDDRDLALLIGGDAADITRTAYAFEPVDQVTQYRLVAPDSDCSTVARFAENLGSGDLLPGVEAATRAVETNGFAVSHRVNNLN